MRIITLKQHKRELELKKLWNFAMPSTRIYAKIIAIDFVKVLPMSAPTGQMFYLDYTYGKYEKKNNTD